MNVQCICYNVQERVGLVGHLNFKFFYQQLITKLIFGQLFFSNESKVGYHIFRENLTKLDIYQFWIKTSRIRKK